MLLNIALFSYRAEWSIIFQTVYIIITLPYITARPASVHNFFNLLFVLPNSYR